MKKTFRSKILFTLYIFIFLLTINLNVSALNSSTKSAPSEDSIKKIALELIVKFANSDFEYLSKDPSLNPKLQSLFSTKDIQAARDTFTGTYVSSSVLDITHDETFCVRINLKTTLSSTIFKVYVDDTGIISSFWINSITPLSKNRAFYSFIIGLIFFSALHALMPYLTRKTIIFGVRIPHEKIQCKEILQIKKANVLIIFLVLVPVNLILNYILFKSKFYPKFEVTLLILLLEFSLLFLCFYFKTKSLKKSLNWTPLMSTSIIVDTKYTYSKRKRVILSPLWYLIPYGIIIFSFYFISTNSNSLGDLLPVSWSFWGQPLSWVDNNPKFIFMFHKYLFILCTTFLVCNFVISFAKQNIDPDAPALSIKRDSIFRKRISILIYLLNLSMIISPIVFNLNSLNIISVSDVNLKIFCFLCYFLSPALFIIMLLMHGQGGSRLLSSSSKSSTEKFKTVNDDKFWKLGFIYFNKNDPSIFVEKRHGIGYSINFGNMLSILILIIFLAVMFFINKF